MEPVTEQEAMRLSEITQAMANTLTTINEMQKNVLTLVRNNTKDEFFIQLINHCFEREKELQDAQMQMMIEGAMISSRIN